jgi:hypothetical protein
MKTIACPACKAVNSADEAACGTCGESLAGARLEQTIAELNELNARMLHLSAKSSPGFSSINGFGTTLLDYRARGDGTCEAVRWIIAMFIPLIPLGGYVIQPHLQENTYGRQTSSFTVLGRVPLTARRIVRTYLLIVVGLGPLLLGWANHRWVNRTLDGGPAFLLMLATVVWAAYIVLVRIKNDGGVYKPKPLRAAV